MRKLFAISLLALGSGALAWAQDLTPQVLNPAYDPNTPADQLPLDIGLGTAGQFGGLMQPASSAPRSPANPRGPVGAGGTILTRSTLGGIFSGSVPQYFIGDIIRHPLAVFQDTQVTREVGLRREPVTAADGDFWYVTAENPNLASAQRFDPADLIADYFWSPHARFAVKSDPGSDEEIVTALDDPEGTIANGFVYASRAGRQVLFYRTEVPIGLTGGSEPIFGLVSRAAQVSSGSTLPVRRVFWTERSFQSPPVEVPAGEIQQVRFAYHDTLPAQVPEAEVFDDGTIVNEGESPLTRTLWFDPITRSIRAYNLEGRILVELLAEARNTDGTLRRQIGVEVVDVIREAPSTIVNVPLGERLYPLDPDAVNPEDLPEPDERSLTPAEQAAGLARYLPDQVLNVTTGEFFTNQFDVDGQTALYAERETASPNDVQIYWQEEGFAGLLWPRFLNRYRQFWPDELGDYVLNLRPSDDASGPGTTPILGESQTPQLVYQDDPGEDQAYFNIDGGLQVDVDPNDPVNRSLLLFLSNNSFHYVRVESVLDTAVASDPRYAEFFRDSMPGADGDPVRDVLFVGERAEPPPGAFGVAGWNDFSVGDQIDPTAYLDPFTEGIEAAQAGAIIPVNALPVDGEEPELDIWWFREVRAPAGSGIETIYVPSYLTRHIVRWPEAPARIVLAANEGADATQNRLNPRLYRQNDPAAFGYNPNEEHAVIISGTVWAMRDDLNHGNSSEPYVLLRYENPADERPEIDVFQVLREDSVHDFNYHAVAGRPIQAPMPLPILPVPLRPDGTTYNYEDAPAALDDPDFEIAADTEERFSLYESFTYEDRKGLLWLYRGPHDPQRYANPGQRPDIGMRFYYNTLAEFDFPDETTGANVAPPVGTVVPYLRERDENGEFVGQPDSPETEPQRITFVPHWPDEPNDFGEAEELPVLFFGETLVEPKRGLPGVGAASSARILYQQATALSPDLAARREAATLHDPTVRKIALLDTNLPEIPPGMRTSTQNGRTYFQGLPPHLEERFYFDPNLTNPELPPNSTIRGGLVLEGRFFDEIVGEDYLQSNVLNAEDTAALKALGDFLPETATDDSPSQSDWDQAIDRLTVTLETWRESPTIPGTYEPNPVLDVEFGPSDFVEVLSDESPVDSYALTAVGNGDGYVVLVMGDGTIPDFQEPGEPVQMQIFRVGDRLYQGEVKPLTSLNPLIEQVTMQHTGDFAGALSDFEFEWRYAPTESGQPPAADPSNGSVWFPYGNGPLGPRITVGGSEQPLLMLTDNYYVMRYRARVEDHPAYGDALANGGDADGTLDPAEGWSEWTEPRLAEGWIKRVLAGINPFGQRLQDFFNNAVDTDVSLLTQAGPRWEGDIPLTLDAVADAGLIEIYETVLRRATQFTIDGNPPINYGPANDALLLVTGYLNDLYYALGNEAFADASNPLIALDVDPSRLLQDQGLPSSIGTTIENTATARFAFEGQVPTLLEEEMVLLRGRDDRLVPGTETSPVYNRFFWNFTRGIDAGEVIYALNYNIREKSGPEADGKIDAADAARLFPQGHGDAYGHYLTALKNYYGLLSDINFTWIPRVEAVNILGAPVTVDYFDERRFARTAAAVGETASRIIDLERRQLAADALSGWSGLRENVLNERTGRVRRWGVEDWAVRAGQGNYLHWLMANAMLPAEDLVNEGLQRIDRTTVPELDELVSLGETLQNHLNAANARVNALGLAENSLLFDLSPADYENGSTHFDQILDRAKAALKNAAVAHERTVETNNLLRSIANQADDYNFTVAQEEIALTNRLLDLLGQPYPGHIGPGRTYEQGYTGPDFFHAHVIDRGYVYQRDAVFRGDGAKTFELKYRDGDVLGMTQDFDGVIQGFDGTGGAANLLREEYNQLQTFTYDVNLNDGPWQFSTPELGQRPQIGEMQVALAEMMTAEEDLFHKLRSMEAAQGRFETALANFAEDTEAQLTALRNTRILEGTKLATNRVIGIAELVIKALTTTKRSITEINNAAQEALPTSVGFSNDVTSPGRAAFIAAAALANKGLDVKEFVQETLVFSKDLAFEVAELNVKNQNIDLGRDIKLRATIEDFRAKYRALFSSVSDIDRALQEYLRANERYRNVLVDVDTILAERETFRKRAAAVIQGSRVRDVAFRAFRTESLEQYQILFDQAARYAYLAAQAYDYETGLLGSPSGREFLADMVSTRALGLVGDDGEPQFAGSGLGDPGLSGLLARLEADWNVARGRLGLNNPDENGTLFSLRREFFTFDGDPEGDTAWADALRAAYRPDLRSDPDIAAHALPADDPSGLPQPGFVFEFPTTVTLGENFFGNALAGGDSAFSAASFATKIFSVGVVFEGYVGMSPCPMSGMTGPECGRENALSATPYVYLLPVGQDTMRTPPLDGAPVEQRSWLVHDYAMPMPFDIGGGGFSETADWTSSTALSERFFVPRKHQAFRAVDDPDHFASSITDEFTNRRLIGRSVWNSRWKLVIPAQKLLADPEAAAERFIRTVSDIQLFMRTYSYSGN